MRVNLQSMNTTKAIASPLRPFTVGIILPCLFLLLAALSGCGSSAASEAARTPESVFGEGLAAFNDNDYLEAQKLFDVIKLQYPASPVADDAQFYLAEINYKKGEYVLAAYNYNLLRRAFPSSTFAKDALYRASMSYFQLSPDSQRDQSYTKQAIQSFAEFQTFYPGDSLSSEAAKRITELREKLAQRLAETAQMYMQLDYPRSALLYYDQVIAEFPDTQFLETSYFGKIKVLVRLNRLDEARESARMYRQQFPSGKHLDEVRQIAGL